MSSSRPTPCLGQLPPPPQSTSSTPSSYLSFPAHATVLGSVFLWHARLLVLGASRIAVVGRPCRAGPTASILLLLLCHIAFIQLADSTYGVPWLQAGVCLSPRLHRTGAVDGGLSFVCLLECCAILSRRRLLLPADVDVGEGCLVLRLRLLSSASWSVWRSADVLMLVLVLAGKRFLNGLGVASAW